MTAPPLDSPAAAAAFVGQLPESHRVRLLAALLGLKTNEAQNLPVGIPTAEQDAEYARRVREGGTSLSADELVEWIKTTNPPAS